MSEFQFDEHPHRRYNPLTESWVLVSPHRTKRPWQGQVEKSAEDKRPSYDPTCYLCPTNTRSNGEKNPDYENVYVFTNDFSALIHDTPAGQVSDGELFQAESESGICKVICFSPRHDLTIPEMEAKDIRRVVDAWCQEYEGLGTDPKINHVQIFENKGFVMGCSNPHPHGQIWAQYSIPDEPYKKQIAQKKYYDRHGRTLLSDYLTKELEKKERILFEHEHFVALIPFWAVWPYEAMIIPKRPMASILEMTSAERDGLAEAYRQLTIIYDNLFEVSFPYSAGIHQAPTDGDVHEEWHWHFVFLPPLLRSATVKKFMVGYEMLANPQRDITPEQSAQRLRELPREHYKK
ncbi:UDP-glucose--hexose-1-phosphate uridylyltransferase [Siphonobacter curvatus]|uniref:Galactose-1-phosphate uridylyltransferase n=2 Tax=Siphonobacter TaxID=700450 RepID=A0A2S7III2_9BACT|nr:UDP-glucose--hexose-1-phosphate uridylyltransferase [Siphonobacter curvatus]PQA56124.1 galactose-1-phosphate uridylyltransferase [Siphonobacter curvatus]